LQNKHKKIKCFKKKIQKLLDHSFKCYGKVGVFLSRAIFLADIVCTSALLLLLIDGTGFVTEHLYVLILMLIIELDP
jgi:hypothetical protein